MFLGKCLDLRITVINGTQAGFVTTTRCCALRNNPVCARVAE